MLREKTAQKKPPTNTPPAAAMRTAVSHAGGRLARRNIMNNISTEPKQSHSPNRSTKALNLAISNYTNPPPLKKYKNIFFSDLDSLSNSLTRELKIRGVGFGLKKLLTYFEMLIVPHALHCVDGCFFVFYLNWLSGILLLYYLLLLLYHIYIAPLSYVHTFKSA